MTFWGGIIIINVVSLKMGILLVLTTFLGRNDSRIQINCLSLGRNIFWGSLPFDQYTIWGIVIHSTDNPKGFLEDIFRIFILSYQIDIPKHGRHYNVFGNVNDRISIYKKMKHIGHRL